MKALSSSYILPLFSLLILPFFSLHTYLLTPTYSLISLLPFLPLLFTTLPLPLTHIRVPVTSPTSHSHPCGPVTASPLHYPCHSHSLTLMDLVTASLGGPGSLQKGSRERSSPVEARATQVQVWGEARLAYKHSKLVAYVCTYILCCIAMEPPTTRI